LPGGQMRLLEDGATVKGIGHRNVSMV
jgi:hypothetical protein